LDWAFTAPGSQNTPIAIVNIARGVSLQIPSAIRIPQFNLQTLIINLQCIPSATRPRRPHARARAADRDP
jgi:hypothetical protein